MDSEEESWDLKIDRAREEMSDKGDIFDRAGREADSAKLALKENYESAVTQEAKAWSRPRMQEYRQSGQ